MYVGTDEALVSVSPDAVTSDNPTWTRRRRATLPEPSGQRDRGRPVELADRLPGVRRLRCGDPGQRGHVFATTDGGKNCQRHHRQPARRARSTRVVLDPSDPNTMYVGTDVGAVRDDQRRPHLEARSAAAFPKVASGSSTTTPPTACCRRHPRPRRVHAQEHATPRPALVVSKIDSGVPVGPGSTIDYTITVRNIGNADGDAA